LDDLPGIEELKAAGLLDSRPGLSSYANRADEEGEPIDIGEDLDEEELERRALGAFLVGDAGEDETGMQDDGD
jgi:segregation and condensation protein B